MEKLEKRLQSNEKDNKRFNFLLCGQIRCALRWLKGMGENLITKLNDTSWQKEFLEMKSHSTSDVRLLMQGAKGFRDAWHLGSLHEEYKIMKRREHQQQQ